MTTKVISFLNSIGIETKEQKGVMGFIPGVLIDEGKLLYDLELASIADVLHEAGHIAVIPLKYRTFMRKGLTCVFKRMSNALERENIEHNSPLFRAILHCSDPEATLD